MFIMIIFTIVIVCGREGYMLVSLIRPHGTSLEVYIPMMVVRTVMMVGVHTYNADDGD